MKTILLLFISLCITMMLQAQVSKTVEVTAGNLKYVLSSEELNTVTNLTITGTIDARDFKTMRDDMPFLDEIDLRGVEIAKYAGTLGTSGKNTAIYPENYVPNYAFYNPGTKLGKIILKAILLPSSVTSIGYGSFINCSGLVSMIIPSRVTSIGERSFAGCIELKSIYSHSKFPVDLSSSLNVFQSVNKTNCILYIPFGTSRLYAGAAQWEDFNSIIEGTQGFIAYGSSLCLSDTLGSTSTIEMQSNVGWKASSNVSWLSVKPGSGTKNQILTFTAESNTTRYPRNATVTISAIGYGSQTIAITQEATSTPLIVTAGNLNTLFSKEELSSISEIKLSGTIDARDFRTMRDSMPNLSKIDLSRVTIAEYSGNSGTNRYSWDFAFTYYPANAIPIYAFSSARFGYGYYSYYGNKSLKSIILPSTVTSVADYAFSSCIGLTSVSIPSSVTSIGDYSFSGCRSLTSISIPPSVTAINSGTFSYCTSLDSVIIPPSIYDIGSYSFSGCTGLTSVTICSVVFNIYDGAFSNCDSLKSIYTNSTFPQYLYSSSAVFSGVNTDDCILYVPHGSKGVYLTDNQWSSFKNVVEVLIVELSATALNIAYSQGSSTTTNIVSNLSWKVISDKSWLTVNPGSSTGDQTLVFTADANPAINPRTATVTISADGVDSQTISVTQEGGPTALADLAKDQTQLKCYPNPFTNEISIEIQNPKRTEISVDIYNLTGERIKTLATKRKDEKLDLKWNGTSDSGQKVATGVYICKVNNQSKQLIYQGQKGKN
ncbi:MAG: leucine-rich repeat protein [Bacteroidia bacterium]